MISVEQLASWSILEMFKQYVTSQVCICVVTGWLNSGCLSLLIVSAPPAPSDGAREEDQAAAVHDAAAGQQWGQELDREHQLSGHRSTQWLRYSPTSSSLKSTSASLRHARFSSTYTVKYNFTRHVLIFSSNHNNHHGLQTCHITTRVRNYRISFVRKIKYDAAFVFTQIKEP